MATPEVIPEVQQHLKYGGNTKTMTRGKQTTITGPGRGGITMYTATGEIYPLSPLHKTQHLWMELLRDRLDIYYIYFI